MGTTLEYGSLEAGRHCNYYTYDPSLQFELRRRCDPEELDWGESNLREFGAMIGHTVADNADVADDNPPKLRTHNKHGEVINEIEHHPAHIENERLVYEAGVIADVFESPPGREDPVSFPYHFGQFYLMEYASSVGLSCPGAMTGGAALVLDKFDDGSLQRFYDGLTARDYDDLMTGAMFLTEKQGGTDVGANEVTAEPQEDGTYELYGEKWFCSNIDSEAALVLARRPAAPDGTEGLSLFLVSTHDRDGEPTNYRFRRLKDKLGTVTVPTGEVVFEGAEAYLIGESENGFRQMSEMLNAERLYNAIGSCGSMGRSLLESKVHAANREVFGKRLDEHPLMRRDLAEMATDHEAALAFTFEAVEALHRRERENDDEAHRLMRILVPTAKYRTARMAVDTASYAMEIKGGNGYVEEFVHPRLLRNAQVLPIWEGASNVMALDVLRSMDREAAHEPLLTLIDERLDSVTHPVLERLAAEIRDERDGLANAITAVGTSDGEYAQTQAKELTDYIFDVTTAAILVEQAQWQLDVDGDARKALVTRQFVNSYLREHDARGITGGGELSTEAFDAVVRYAAFDPDQFEDLVVMN
ncbi:acyl-CoA dehydrogenase [Halogeometricum borinquense DSM 11551]|uniref:Acyl-CoA dehydrogenase n=1 Tax=Halogeometricum borinquense (strain ATCC 700274 / DSM 11551 / JCM 10706 / KCTC 4070 / PR3) TaxID=469382 RepID=E4NU34_HALBP|nr:acyl-CoA dehydrogenase family protein [Halogeometricum borinquense]ADQ68554.1 acyl-CoA dehydrogenase [Halogeometricum borinquense DSM 11551]ELY25575.1 acyl-CoA dehydrogenase [Halogeometricum borinquense DSM 11551]